MDNAGRKNNTEDIKMDGTCGDFLMKYFGNYHPYMTETEMIQGKISLTLIHHIGAENTGVIGTRNESR